MVDVTKLTQEQQWGLAYATLLANGTIQSENNAKPDDEKTALFNESSYAEFILRGACDSYYTALIEEKKKNAIEKFNSLAPEQQAALLAQLQVPDVLQGE